MPKSSGEHPNMSKRSFKKNHLPCTEAAFFSTREGAKGEADEELAELIGEQLSPFGREYCWPIHSFHQVRRAPIRLLNPASFWPEPWFR